MSDAAIGASVTILIFLITGVIKLFMMVNANKVAIAQEETRSKIEDRHHSSELETIKSTLKDINDKLDKITKELLGNGNGNKHK